MSLFDEFLAIEFHKKFFKLFFKICLNYSILNNYFNYLNSSKTSG